MWPLFFLTLLIAIALLCAPGAMLTASFSKSAPLILAGAPLVSIALYNLLSIIYGYLHIPASFFSIALPVLLVSLLVFVVSRIRHAKVAANMSLSNIGEPRESETLATFIADNRTFLLFAVLYVAVAAAISAYFFLLPLDGPDCFVQDSDNSFHLSLIRSFLDSGDYSSLSTTLYPEYPSDYLDLANSGRGFYPAAWHCLCALLSSATSCSVALSANALNLALLSVVFPLSVLAFLSSLFRENNFVLAAGAFVSLAFAAFPWGALYPSSGPLYPNYLGFCLAPAVCALFVEYIDTKKTIGTTVRLGIPFLCGLISCALSHPNVLFSCLVILGPFCVARIARAHFGKRGIPVLLAVLFSVLLVSFWLLSYNLPFLQGVVNFEWAPVADLRGAILSVANLSLRIGFEQPLLAIIVALGIVSTIKFRNNLWLLCPWALSCLMYVVCASTDGELENILTGFWYSDPYRIAILVALCSLPLSAYGLGTLFQFVSLLLDTAATRLKSIKRRKKFIVPMGMAVVALLFSANVYRSTNSAWDSSTTTTAFGNVKYCLTVANDSKRDNTFDPEEYDFCEEISELVDSSYLIYNCPDDGSPFAYALCDLNLCFRRSAAETLEYEPDYSRLLRYEIDDIATNEEVQQYLAEANVRYILVLDYGGEPLPERCYYGYYTWEKWPGMNSITDATPGLSILLSEGDMRLYEINWGELV